MFVNVGDVPSGLITLNVFVESTRLPISLLVSKFIVAVVPGCIFARLSSLRNLTFTDGCSTETSTETSGVDSPPFVAVPTNLKVPGFDSARLYFRVPFDVWGTGRVI